MSNQSRIRTKKQAKADLCRRGVSVAQFARAHGLAVGTVYHVLSGVSPALRGEAHKAAVLLGIKNGVIEQGGE